MFKDEEADQMFIAVVLRIPNIHLFVERCKEHRRTIGALSKEDIENIETEISRLAKGGFFVNKNEPFGVRRLGALGRVDAGWHHSGRES